MHPAKTSSEFERWYDELSEKEQLDVSALIQLLREKGPTLGRPYVDTLRDSRYANLKELRSGSLRIIFIFDPDRNVVLLLGGDKSQMGGGKWNRWYKKAIPEAERLYDEYLAAESDGKISSQDP